MSGSRGKLLAPSKRHVVVPPSGVIQRGSTETVAIDDPAVSEAVRHIREHLHERLSVGDLLRHVPVSRRALEYRFRAALNVSPHSYELQEAHAARAKSRRRLTWRKQATAAEEDRVNF
jgi:LacI family transcriptional regulator